MTRLLRIVSKLPESAEVPSEFQLFPYGIVGIVGKEPFLVDEAAMALVISNFQARGLEMVIDYEHQTMGKTEEGIDFSSPDGKAPAAGWIKSLEARGKDGLWAKVEWTPKAKEFLSNKEYRYFSPVFYTSKTDRRLVAVENVALTNSPRLNNIRPIVAKSQAKEREMDFLKQIAKLLGLAETATEQDVTAAIAKLQTSGPEFLKLCATSAGIAETSTNDQVIAAIKTSRETVACKDVLDALGVKPDASRSEIIASIHALKQRPDATVVQEIAALKAKLAARDADELVAAALKSGKITPAQKEWAEKYAQDDPEGFKLFVAKAPQVVPVGKTGIVPDKNNPTGLDETQLQINKMMGVDEATWKKHNPPAQA